MLLQGDGMEGDEQVAAAQFAAQILLQLFAAEQGQAADVVQTQGADVENGRGLLAQLKPGVDRLRLR